VPPPSEGRGGLLGQVLRNSAALPLAQVLKRTTALIISLIIAHRLGAAAFGLYSVAPAFYGLITTIGENGVRNYFGREVSRDPQRTPSTVSP
jgi:O-antigen/teichoic acid export membrane protein